MPTIAIGNYTELQSAISDWLVDQNLGGREAAFIQLAEAMFNRDIRARKMMAVDTASTVPGNRFISMPDDLLEARSLTVSGSPTVNLLLVTPAEITSFVPQSGKPVRYAVIGDSFMLHPTPDMAYTLDLIYYEKIPALSDTQPNNWLLINHPDVYLYGSLLQAELFTRNDGKAPTWQTAYQNAVAGIKGLDDRAMFSGGAVQIRIDPGMIV